MPKVIFKHPDQSYIYKPLLDAVNKLCADYKKDAECVSGYRSLECQKATNAQVLARCKTNYQLPNGAVYNSKKQCLASAYGKSNHCFCIAMDLNGWIEELNNEQLKPYGLIKPINYEPWHVQLIETTGISEVEKIKIRDSVLTPPDELKQALKFISSRANIEYDTWYKIAKTVKYLDKAFIKIWKAWRDEK